ncbi:MAG: transcription elongation factor GreA [Spirochaetes bacterium]|nr:transcription elongation factor GreA [Spirochaetota bacterium]
MGLESIEKKKQELKDEIDKLKHEFKVELPKKIAEAREHGDLKENADYHAARERQGFVRAKIAQLSDEVRTLTNLSSDDIPEDKVGFGSTVLIKNISTGEEKEFTFVTDAESEPSAGRITLSTPFGTALRFMEAGATVTVNLPMSDEEYKILKIKTIHGNELKA